MDINSWRLVWDIAQTVATVGVGVYVWFVNRDRVTNSRITNLRDESGKRIEKLEKTVDARMDRQAERLTKVEAVCGHHPNHGDLSKVYDRINGLAEKQAETQAGVADLQGEMRSVLRQLNLINDHLINKGH